jgi:hypothetical protein
MLPKYDAAPADEDQKHDQEGTENFAGPGKSFRKGQRKHQETYAQEGCVEGMV